MVAVVVAMTDYRSLVVVIGDSFHNLSTMNAFTGAESLTSQFEEETAMIEKRDISEPVLSDH